MNLAQRLHLVLAALTLPFIPLSGYAQAHRYVACVDEKAWVVDGGAAVHLGACSEGVRVAPLAIGRWASTPESSKTARALEVLSLLKGLPKAAVKPTSLTEAGLKGKADIHPREAAVSVDVRSLPSHVAAFFERTGSDPPSKVFYVTVGVYYVTYKRYEEYDRYVVRVPGENPTIGSILAEAQRQPLADYLKHTVPYLSLRIPHKDEVLDGSKTAAEYGLKEGSVLWLTSSVR